MLLIRGVLFLLLFGVTVSGPAEAQTGLTVTSLTVSPARVEAGKTVTFAATITATRNFSRSPIAFSWFRVGAARSTATTALVYATLQANKTITQTYIETIPADTAAGSYTLDVGSPSQVNASTTFAISSATMTPVNGTCGPVNGTGLTRAPTTDLCSAGTASVVTGSGPWMWTCAGSHGGTTAACHALVGDPTAGLLTTSRDAYANWSKAGLLSVGGIPSRSTRCGTTLAPSGGDDTAAINSAISSCPAGDVLMLGAGTFLINAAGVPVTLNKGITIRGQGPGVTILHSSDGATLNSDASGTHSAAIIAAGGSGTIAATTNLTADGVKGAYSIQVASTTGFAVGGLVHVDELAYGQAMPDCCFNGGTGTVWAEPDYRVEWNQHDPAVEFFDSACNGYSSSNNFSCGTNGDECAYSVRCGGVNEELHLITAINSSTNTITFDSPLTFSYRVRMSATAHSYPPSSIVSYAGVENLTMSNGDQGNLVFQACVYCWAHEVESTVWLNAGGFAFFAAAFRDQVDFSWVHNAAWPVNGGGGYAINLTFGASEEYIFNNIDMLANKVDVVRASGSGTVFAYNYMDDGYINGTDTWVETGINCSHLAGSHHVLFEGNYTFNSDNDFTHGSSSHCTFFRNYMSGFRAPFTALDGTPVNDATNTPAGVGPLRAIADHPYAYWDSFIGNVAGVSGAMSSWTYRCAAGNADSGCAPAVFNLGWNDTSVSGSLADGSMELSYPTRPTSTITGPGCLTSGESCAPIVDGNYDYKSNSIQWATNDTAHALPNSFYLSSKPTFFSAGSGYTWPWVVPTSTTQQLHTLPAKARWDARTPFTQP